MLNFAFSDSGNNSDKLIGNNGVIKTKTITAAVHFKTLKRKIFYLTYPNDN
ncbi:MAG: hypothetical protein ACTS77_02470 [Arsenophonus sp. NC-TX2-MAG3]